MRNNLIVLLPVSAERPLYWGVWSDDELIESGTCDLANADQLSEKSSAVTLVLPGQNIRNFEHDLPKMSRRERAKAVLFAVEDNLSSPLDNFHVALKDHSLTENETRRIVSVIDREIMQDATDWATSIGLNVQYIISDFEALTGIDYEAIALDDRIISPGLLGHTLDRDWYQGAAEHFDALTVLKLIAPRVTQATNLMQGEFSPKSNLKGETKSWLQLGGLAACLGLAFIIFQLSEARAVKKQAENIRAQTANLYAERTGQTAPSNPARAIARSAGQGQITPTQFLALSDISFRALESFDDVSIERVSYQSNRNELQLRLIYPSFERADDVQQAMAAAGGQFTPGGVREQGGRFVGEAVLKLAGAS